MGKDLYEVLGVAKTASQEEIKKAYKKLAQLYHPDMHATASEEEKSMYEEKFKEINNAHEILSNEQSRTAYDRELAREESKKRSSSSQCNYNTSQTNHHRSANTRHSSQTADNRESKKNPYNSADQTEYDIDKEESDYDDTEQADSENFLDFIYKTKEEYARAWKEVKKEEKKDSLKKRHTHLNEQIHAAFNPKNDKISSKIGYGIYSGVIHISYEFIHELSKLNKTKGETGAKYVVRNRRFLATLLTMAMIFTCAASATAEPKEPTEPSKQVVTFDPFDPFGWFDDDVIVYRKYEVQWGDTLTSLSKMTNTSIYDIAESNHMDSTDILMAGDTILLPYTYDEKDQEFFTDNVLITEGTHVTDLAEEYNTTRATIEMLNEGNINSSGHLTGTEATIPNFKTQDEIDELKKQDNQGKIYTKN